MLVLVGMLLNVNIYWFVIDILVMLVCAGSGFFLLREQKQVELPQAQGWRNS
jgi:hypothetical protein